MKYLVSLDNSIFSHSKSDIKFDAGIPVKSEVFGELGTYILKHPCTDYPLIRILAAKAVLIGSHINWCRISPAPLLSLYWSTGACSCLNISLGSEEKYSSAGREH